MDVIYLHKYCKIYFLLPESRGACFPAEAILKLENGKSIAMSELCVGDRVQAGIDRCFTF